MGTGTPLRAQEVPWPTPSRPSMAQRFTLMMMKIGGWTPLEELIWFR